MCSLLNSIELNDIGLNLTSKTAQVPENFPKQHTETPPFYKYSDGSRVQRLNIPPEYVSWDIELPETFVVPSYTSPSVLYHSVLEKNPFNLYANQDLTFKEFNPKTRQMEHALRMGWADPEDINQVVPKIYPISAEEFDKINTQLISEGKKPSVYPTKLRCVNMTTKQEIEWNKFLMDTKYLMKEEEEKEFTQSQPTKYAKMSCDDKSDKSDKYVRKFLKQLSGQCANLGIKLRYSFAGPIRFDTLGYPLNPIGRTGLKGRGTLGNWGPNHAADPVVARSDPETGKLQFVLIKRLDNGEWALPGGMVEAGQNIADARTREFAEEALNTCIQEGESELDYAFRTKELEVKLKRIFANSDVDSDNVLYQGVVDDPRNTDNSWMETTAILTLLNGSDALLNLTAGDDAGKVKWVNYNSSLKLFASHSLFIELAVNKLLSRGLIYKDVETCEFFFY